MTDIKEAFGSVDQAITITLSPGATGIASGNARESAAVDNTSLLFHDAEVELQIKLKTGSPSGQKSINVYVAIGQAGGSGAFTDNATGADANITLRSPSNLFGPFRIQTPDSGSLTWKALIPSIVAIIGGTHLPPKWSIIIENQTGLSFSDTEGDHTHVWRGQYATD
jgi:hypothetical protein